MDDTNGVDVCELNPVVEPAPPPVWTTKDGRKLTAIEMTDEHLRNAARALRRKAGELGRSALDCFGGLGLQGEMALMAAEHEGQDLADKADACTRWALHFEHELARRGVSVSAAGTQSLWLVYLRSDDLEWCIGQETTLEAAAKSVTTSQRHHAPEFASSYRIAQVAIVDPGTWQPFVGAVPVTAADDVAPTLSATLDTGLDNDGGDSPW